MEIPSAFDLNDLLSFLGERRGKFNIRASQSWGSLYVLDLAETHKFLKSLSEYSDNAQSTFLDFIDHRIIDSKDKAKNWLNCVKDCDPMNNIYVSCKDPCGIRSCTNRSCPVSSLPVEQHAEPCLVQFCFCRREHSGSADGCWK